MMCSEETEHTKEEKKDWEVKHEVMGENERDTEDHLVKSCGFIVIPQIQCSQHSEASSFIILHHILNFHFCG